MKVWIVRHGESETNKNKMWTGWLDVPLTEKGRADAALAGEFLSKVSFDKVYSSDLMRARTTAEIAIPGCKYEALEMLREIDVGNIAGKPLDATKGMDTALFAKEGYAIFGGERKADFKNRVLEFMKILESEDCENIAVFAHAGYVRTFFDLVLGIDHNRKKVACENCAIGVFEYKDGNWRVYSWINLG